MRAFTSQPKIYRIIDVNINRTKEGLRVCEEIARFLLADRLITSDFKRIRHNMDSLARRFPVSTQELLEARDSRSDVGRRILADELKRGSSSDIFFANIQRAKESVRVLEEFSKLVNTKLAFQFKEMRYVLYEIEKRAVKRIASLLNH